MSDLIPLSLLELDCPAPPAGWTAELARRGVAIVVDDLGRRAISRDAARLLLSEHEEQEARKARHRQEIERRAIEADQAFRAALPPGIRADEVPPGLTPAMLMMAADPMGQGSRRETVVEHALRHQGGAVIFHPIEGASDYHPAGGES